MDKLNSKYKEIAKKVDRLYNSPKVIYFKSGLSRFWSIIIIISVVLGIYFGFVGIRNQIKQNSFPDVLLAWYENDNGYLKLIPLNDIKIKLTYNDILLRRAKLPVNIALQNNDDERFDIVRVELQYDSSMSVISKARQLIPRKRGTIIYDHEIITLDNVDNFTPLATVDTLVFPLSIVMEDVIILSKEKIPDYWISTYISDKDSLFTERTITFTVKIFCENRPVLVGNMSIRISPDFQLIYPPVLDFNKVQITSKDIELFNGNLLDRFKTINHWTRAYLDTGGIIEYYFLSNKDSVLQLVLYDELIRRLNIDSNNDRMLDYVILDTDIDGFPDTKIEILGLYEIIDWDENAAKQ